MSASSLEYPVSETPAFDTFDAAIESLIEKLAVTDGTAERVVIIDAALHLYIPAIVEAHGSFSSLDIAGFSDAIANNEVPLIPFMKRGTSTIYKRLISEANGPLLSGAEKSTRLSALSFDNPLDSGEIAGTAVVSDSATTIKGASQRSKQASFTLKNNTQSSSTTHCVSSLSLVQDVVLPMPAEWLPSVPRTDSFGLLQNDVAAAGEQDEKTPSRKLDALDTILASYREQGDKVTTHFDTDAIRAMRNKYQARNKDGSPKTGTLNMEPILADGNRVMWTVMLVEEGMDLLTGRDLYNIRKSLFERFESAFSVKMSCIWKTEFVPAAKSKMVRKHATNGFAHMHFNLNEPQTRSAHSRKSQFAKDFNGLTPAEWLEATIRDITNTPNPKKRSMTHSPKRGERGEYPDSYYDAVNQMTCYFAKAGKNVRDKQIQNYVPLSWLARGEIHLKFWGANALKRF
ncbi:hypothetical protein [Arthrobacter sp. UYCo732]|uniref:hypothetical protein n=1 Tax=Arthrobacter sp. UYCo732 TaxID=3156336 RepID=UPI003398C86D